MVRFAFMASLTSEVVGGGGANAESQQPLSCGNDWQAALACMIRDPVELCRLLELDPALAAEAQQAAAGFPLLVSREYVARIHSGDPQDPLLRQILPRAAETATVPGFRADPLGEAGAAVHYSRSRLQVGEDGVAFATVGEEDDRAGVVKYGWVFRPAVAVNDCFHARQAIVEAFCEIEATGVMRVLSVAVALASGDEHDSLFLSRCRGNHRRRRGAEKEAAREVRQISGKSVD